MTPINLIIFLFVGHSNMNGHCSIMDTVLNAHVWIYKNGEFKNGTDRDYGGDNNESGSVVLPFLKLMAAYYPNYNFIGIKMASSCAQAWHRKPGDSRYDYAVKQVKELQAKGGTVGGVLMMYGFVEGKIKDAVDSIHVKVPQLVEALRSDIRNSSLPVIFGRYEENGDKSQCPEYHVYDDDLISQINSLPALVDNLSLAPWEPVPAKMYCDNHHYNAEGYQLWASDAIATMIYNGYIFWDKK